MPIQRYDMKLYTNEYNEVDYHVDKVEEGRFVRYFDYKVLELRYKELLNKHHSLLFKDTTTLLDK